MPAACARAGLIWCAFLHNAPRRDTAILTPRQARRLAQKYGRQRAWITDALIACHQASAIALLAWFAAAAANNVLPLDDRTAVELFGIQHPTSEPMKAMAGD
jgi:hypothetical protein